MTRFPAVVRPAVLSPAVLRRVAGLVLAALLSTIVADLVFAGAAGAQAEPQPTTTTTTTAPPAPEPPPAPAPEPTPAAPEPTPLQRMFPGIGPEVTAEQLLAFFRLVLGPPVPANSGQGRRIVYSNSAQRVWLVEDDGSVAKSHLVSGRTGLPRPGIYRIFSKSRSTTSGSARMEFMARFARGRKLAIGFHTIPTRANGTPLQSEAQLGTPRSHGCVRQKPSDAIYLYMWAPVGTPVVVLP